MTPSGNSYVRVFEEYAAGHDKITVRTGTEVTSLVLTDGRVTGVRAVGKDGYPITASARSVILATGGFGADKEMLKEYNTGVWSHR